MEDYGKWEHFNISKALHVRIYTLLPITAFPGKGGDMEEEGHRCPWLVSYHATHQPCLSRSAQLQGPTVRCRVYLGYATSWPEVHSLFHAEMNVPNPGSAPRPALGREWGSVLPRLAKTSAKMLQKAQLEPRALLYPPHSTSGLSGESEGWFNFHPGSPHVWGCQMWQITRVGIWCEVLSAGSGLTVAFHLTCLRWTWNQGLKTWILTTETPHPAYKPFSQGNQLLAKRTPPPDGLWKLRPYKQTGLKEFILGNWNLCQRIFSAHTL